MTSIDPEPQRILQPAVFEFAFSWDSAALHANIVAVKPDYDPRDPRTWALVTHNMIHQDDLNKFMKPGRLLPLPTTVAYESSLMERLAVRIKSTSKKGDGKDIRFMSHPLNFSLRSELRRFDKVCMTMSDHIVWLRKRKTEERYTAAESSQSALPVVSSPATDNSATNPPLESLTHDTPAETESEAALEPTDPATTFERIPSRAQDYFA
jgi:hypothetical protein